MAPMNIIYISLEGNTRSFLTRMQGYAKQQHSISEDCPLIELKEVSDQTLPADETEPFFAFVPTYSLVPCEFLPSSLDLLNITKLF